MQLHRTMQPPTRLPFRNPIDRADDPFGDYTRGEEG